MKKSVMICLVGCTLYLVGCANHTPTAPTAASIDSATTGSSGAAISPARHGGGGSGSGGSGSGGSGSGGSGSGGSGSGGGGNSGPGNGGHDNGGPGNSGPGNGRDNRAELVGTVQAVDGVCPALRITVDGRLVVTNTSTEFRHGPCTALASGQRVEVRGTLEPDGSVLAARVENEDRDDEDADDDEVVGVIASKTGSCPALTFMIGATSVSTNLDTAFDDIVCADLVDGMEVEVNGVRQSDGSLLASRIEPTRVK